MNASKMYYMVLKLQFTHDYVLYMGVIPRKMRRWPTHFVLGSC